MRLSRGVLTLALLATLATLGTAGCADYGGETPAGEQGQSDSGMVEIVLEAEPVGGPYSDVMRLTVDILRGRLHRLGLDDSDVSLRGGKQIVVRLTEAEDLDRIVQAMTRTGTLEFYPVADLGEAFLSAEGALAFVGVESKAALPADHTLIGWPDEYGGEEFYVATTPAVLNGSMLSSAGFDSVKHDGSYRVTLQFSDEGALIFADITSELTQICVATGGLQQLAIVLDGVVWSAPTVHEEITGGSAEITGDFTLQEAQDLALVLNSGTLPVTLRVVSQRPVRAE